MVKNKIMHAWGKPDQNQKKKLLLLLQSLKMPSLMQKTIFIA